MEIEEVVRRWQINESQRAIARATGLAQTYAAIRISLICADSGDDADQDLGLGPCGKVNTQHWAAVHGSVVGMIPSRYRQGCVVRNSHQRPAKHHAHDEAGNQELQYVPLMSFKNGMYSRAGDHRHQMTG
jgi:hypothetical protein